MKIYCQSESKLKLPKSETYTIETPSITQIIYGHGTKEFMKLKGIFSKIPDRTFCLSIIGSHNNEPRSFNIICETAKEAEELTEKVAIIVNYIRKQIGIKDIIKVDS